MNSLVSVIIPVYNVVTYLEECVSSVRQQTYQNLEILLIDDGSTDGSGHLCDQLAQQDKRIKVYHKVNAGLSEARNDGVKASNGEYIYFIDSDDYLIDCYTIEKMILGASQFNVPLVVAAYQRVKEGKTIHCVNLDVISEPKLFNAQDMVEKLYQFRVFNSNFIVTHNKLFKRQLFDSFLFPKGKLHEDEFTTYKLYLKAEQILYLPYETYAFRIRANSIMQSQYSLRRLDIIEAFDERIEVLKEHEIPIYDTVYQLMNKLSYHMWCLSRYGFHSEERELFHKLVDYYQRYSFMYKGKALMQLRLMRYTNFTYRFVYHRIYERFVRLSLRIKSLVMK